MSGSRRPTLSERQNIILLSKVPIAKLNKISALVMRGQQSGRGVGDIISTAMKILGPLAKKFGPMVIEKIIMPLLRGKTPSLFKKIPKLLGTAKTLLPLATPLFSAALSGDGSLKLSGQGRKRKKRRKRAYGGYGTSVGAAKNPLLTRRGASNNPWVQHLKRTHAKYKASGKSFGAINKIASATYKRKI
jgi:hypothetical protein